MAIDRRTFLRLGGMTLVLTAANPLLARVRARGGRPRLGQSLLAADATFILVFLRGGCDALNTCIPVEAGEYAHYQNYRPPTGTIHLPLAALDPYRLSSDFALHPQLAPLHAMYQQGQVAVMPNVHYDDGSRSHFDSQAFYESGTPWLKTTPDGWLSRHMRSLPGNQDVFRAVAFGNGVPAGFRGQPSALTLSSLSSLAVSSSPQRDAQYLDLEEQVYGRPEGSAAWDAEVQQAGRDLIAAIRALRATSLPDTDPAAAALYPKRGGGAYTTFASQFRELAQLLKSGAFAIELGEIDQNGYDSHTGQGAVDPASGSHPALLAELAQTLGAFYLDLGQSLGGKVLTLVVTEFGRTARENGSGGTDHGSATCTFAVGGGVVPGLHFGPRGWISLGDLRDDRDVQHSLDYRDLFAEVTTRFLGNPATATVFPGWSHRPVGFLA